MSDTVAASEASEAQAEYDNTPALRDLLARAAASDTVQRGPAVVRPGTQEGGS